MSSVLVSTLFFISNMQMICNDVMKSIRSIALPAVIIVINYWKMIQKVAK
ncbi:unnamed protein product [Brugia pahangi]|uniref:Transposase n=1 Tax=Brugia pahangi TaxID=6280 RepID=A0A0N4T4Q1_BRUPA|nr:unnamed protein product [Brugia pahangi]